LDVLVAGTSTAVPACSHAKISSPFEVAAISDCNQGSCPDCGASLLCHARQLITVAADVGYLVFDDRNLTRLKVGFDSTLPFVEGL